METSNEMAALWEEFNKKINKVQRELSCKFESVLQAISELRVKSEQPSQANNPEEDKSVEEM